MEEPAREVGRIEHSTLRPNTVDASTCSGSFEHPVRELHLVQCKRWRARRVRIEIVRELCGVTSARGAVSGYVASSGIFSREARNFAQRRNIEPWDGIKLKAFIRKERNPPRP